MNGRNSKSSLKKKIAGMVGIAGSSSRLTVPIIGLAVVLAVTGLTVAGLAGGNNQPPPNGAISFAQNTSDLMTATLIAALMQEFNETTRANVEEGKLSIGLIFADSNTNMRLVGKLDPLSKNDVPQDAFESTALAKALNGDAYTNVERVRGKWFYRRSIPLSNFRDECSYCHTNFPSVPDPTDYVGALMLKVPIAGK